MKSFTSKQFGTFRTVVDGKTHEAYFCLLDVCKVLGLQPHKLSQRLGDDLLSKYPILDTLGRKQIANYVKEDGLYEAILNSRKPEAKAFRKWVTGTVLPQIRQTGGYIPIDDYDDDKALLDKALKVYKKTVARQQALLDAQRPKVDFANALCGSETSIHLSELAKLITQNGYEIGRTRLFAWMREHGYIFKRSTEPVQEWVSRGLFEVRAILCTTPHGLMESVTPLVTVEGQKYFLRLFTGRGI